MSKNGSEFSPFRAYLWPIHSHELYKIIPMIAMAFFIGFNYNILRCMKDALVVTAKNSGAEVIPFLKVWGVLPCAFLMTFIYSRLHNNLKRDRLFYAMIAIFLVFFIVFTFVLYPLRDYLHPDKTADYLQAHLPKGLKGLIAMFRYWTFSSFYIMSELWSSAILSMLFWGFANEITRVKEAKRFYGIISVGVNFAAIPAGIVSIFLTGKFFRSYLHVAKDEWHQSLILLTFAIVLSGILLLYVYRSLSRRLVKEKLSLANPEQEEEKQKMSMREAFRYLARSRYLLCIALIVLSYNIIINLVEVLWKDQVKQLYPDPGAFNIYMSKVIAFTGILSCTISLLVSGQVTRRFGWTASALLTPLVILISSTAFFICFFGQDYLSGFLFSMGTTPLAMVVLLGSIKNCFCRAAKYTVFDATKEMAFVPLNIEIKRKGKAAIDGVGSRLGKSGGSVIHQSLLVVFTTVSASAHILAAMLVAICMIWIYAVLNLGKRFKQAEQTGIVDEGQPEKLVPVLQK